MSNPNKAADFDEQAYQQLYQQFYTDPNAQQGYQQQQQYYQQYQTESPSINPIPQQQPPPPPPPEEEYYDNQIDQSNFYDPNQTQNFYDPNQTQNYYDQSNFSGNQYYNQNQVYYDQNQGGYFPQNQGNVMGKNFMAPKPQQTNFNPLMQKNFKTPTEQTPRVHPNLNNSRTLYIGNLPPETNEDEMKQLVQQFGVIEAVKIVWPKNCAFVKMQDISCASIAHQALDQFNLRGKSLKLGWGKDSDFSASTATIINSTVNIPNLKKTTTIQNPPNRILWLGNITQEVQTNDIMKTFTPFGEIEAVKILNERSCAFVTFYQLDDATRAKDTLQGEMPFGHLPLKINFGKLQNCPKDLDPKRNIKEPSTSQTNNEESNNYTNIEQKRRPTRIGNLANFAGNLPFPPCPTEPEISDPDTKNLITKTADWVAKNGFSFESKIKDTQGNKPSMGFIKDGHPYNDLYRFIVWCRRFPDLDPKVEYEKHEEEAKQWKEDLLNPLTDNNNNLHASNSVSGDIVVKLKEKLAQGQKSSNLNLGNDPLASELIEKVKGRINSTEDLEQLQEQLKNLNPQKDVIKSTKNWIKERPHLTKDLGTSILTHISSSSDPDTRIAFVYLIHDLLTSAVRLRTKKEEMDIYASALLPKLGQILFHAFRKQSKDNQEQIREVLKVWEDKMVYTSEALDNIETEMGVSLPPVPDKKKPSKKSDYDKLDTRSKKSSKWE